MPRFKLTIEYDGTEFVGWQRQDNGPSVQGAIEDAARGYCQVDTVVHGAGRTDSGVHALGQVAHVDLPRNDPPDIVAKALNAHLRPLPIAIIGAEAVSDEFHARFSAIERGYEYRILNRRAHPTLNSNHVWWVGSSLNADAMNDAAQTLVGKHDFSTFRAAECQSSSPVKTIDKITVARAGDNIFVSVRARSFLHHQVRNIVGTLKYVGDGKWTKDDVQSALEKRDRAAGGPTAPAAGLFLTHVRYPD
jgi:tRNA pseudouridine38-40 synthase